MKIKTIILECLHFKVFHIWTQPATSCGWASSNRMTRITANAKARNKLEKRHPMSTRWKRIQFTLDIKRTSSRIGGYQLKNTIHIIFIFFKYIYVSVCACFNWYAVKVAASRIKSTDTGIYSKKPSNRT